MKNNTRKIIAFILAFTMLFGITAITTSAADDTKTYYFSNNKFWEKVYVHYWDDAGTNNGWPGTEAKYLGNNEFGEGVFSIEVPASTKGMVFTAGESGPQTIDLILDNYTQNGFYLTDEADGKWNVGTYDYNPGNVSEGEGGVTGDDSATNENPDRDVTLVLKNSAEWEEVWVYYWPIGGSNSNWPGEELTASTDGLYYAIIPAGNGYVIFNNGKDGEELIQTADMLVPTDDNVLYDNSTDTWSEMKLAANHPEDGGKGGMTFLKKAAKVLLICLKNIELFFKNIGNWFVNLFTGGKK